MKPPTTHDWNDIPLETLNPLVKRQALHSNNMTIAHLHLTRGAVVPMHSHDNEQVTYLREGRLRFDFEGHQSVILEAGRMMVIPGGVPHSVEALEDCLALDLFSPARQDWIAGDDAYLRR